MDQTQHIICVVGGVAAGKSTYIDANFTTVEHVIFRPGKILRDVAGVSWMEGSNNPNAPQEADAIVFAIFRSLLRLSGQLGRSLVCDGFPRTVAQAVTVMDLIELDGLSINLDVVWMKPDSSVHQLLVEKRGSNKFDLIRLSRSLDDTGGVVRYFKNMESSQHVRCRVTELEAKL